MRGARAGAVPVAGRFWPNTSTLAPVPRYPRAAPSPPMKPRRETLMAPPFKKAKPTNRRILAFFAGAWLAFCNPFILVPLDGAAGARAHQIRPAVLVDVGG